MQSRGDESAEGYSNAMARLPPEVLQLVMSWMNGMDLYNFSISCTLFQKLSNEEELWCGAYQRSLSKIHCALMQPPTPEYWTFAAYPNRRFLYLAVSRSFQKPTPPSELDIVMEVLRASTDHPNLLLVICYVIRRLTYTPPGCSQDYRIEMACNRVEFGCVSVVDILLRILQVEPDPTLIAAALCALNNIACDVESNCRTIVNTDGINSILQAMKKHREAIAVLDYGSSALANIIREVQDFGNLSQIITEGVSLAQSLFDQDKVVAANVVSGLDLFTVLARHNLEFRKEFGGTALSLVKDLLVRYNTQTNLTSGCCRAIHEFCKSSDENRQLAINLHLTSMLLEKLEVERDSTMAYSIIFALCFIFWKKTTEEKENFKRFVSISIDRLKAGLEEARFQLGVAIILGNFASYDGEHLRYIQSFNVSKLLAEAIRKHAKKPEKYADILHLFES